MNDMNIMQVLDYALSVSSALAIGYGMYRFAKYSIPVRDKECKREHSLDDLVIKPLPKPYFIGEFKK